MTVIQLVANGTDFMTRKNKNIFSKKIFIDEEMAQGFKDEFYCICTNPIEGSSIQLDPDNDIDISLIPLELVEGDQNDTDRR